MKDWTLENPKATIFAATGVIVFILKIFVFKDKFSPELESWLNVILPTVFGILIARYTRITKSEAIVLEKISDNKNQLKGD
jgi:hypothetical protein